uniref:Putative tick ixostatin n=1 Tax=Rhipicephalus microplus TaxID=6941 RepID=A0A6G5A4N8_RHIMP
MHKRMASWTCLAFLAAIAFVSGDKPPFPCTRVTGTSFGNTSRPPFGPFCEEGNKVTHPNRTWIGFNLKKPHCIICCAGKDSTGNIYYNVSKLSAHSCSNLRKNH